MTKIKKDQIESTLLKHYHPRVLRAKKATSISLVWAWMSIGGLFFTIILFDVIAEVNGFDQLAMLRVGLVFYLVCLFISGYFSHKKEWQFRQRTLLRNQGYEVVQ